MRRRPSRSVRHRAARAAGHRSIPAVDGYALTADDNIIHTRATLTYRISDPIRYVFSFVNASNAVQNALDNALLLAASQFKVDDVLTRDVAGFQEAVRRQRDAVDREAGPGHRRRAMRGAEHPAAPVEGAFDRVLKAEQ